MTDSIKNNLQWVPSEYKERRKWTDEEIREAANHIKKERPDVWQELLREEEATGDLSNLEAAGIAKALLRKLYQNIHTMDISKLFSCIRDVLEEEIEHKNKKI